MITGVPSKFGHGMMYKLPVKHLYDKEYMSMTIFDQGDKLIFQPYRSYPNKPRLAPTADRYVLSVKKGVHLYKLDRFSTRRIYQYTPLDLRHFEMVIYNNSAVHRRYPSAYYCWISKFTYCWLKRNGIDLPKMKFYGFGISRGRPIETHYLWRMFQYANYPISKDRYEYEGDPLIFNMPKKFSKVLRKYNSIRRITKSIFGYNSVYLNKVIHLNFNPRSRKDVVSTEYLLELGYALKGMLPVDYWPRIGEAVEASELYMHHDPEIYKQTKKFLGLMKKERVLALLTSSFYDVGWGAHEPVKRPAITYLFDTVRNWAPFADKIVIPNDISNLQKLHDYMSIEHRKLSNANHPIKLPKIYEDINGAIIGNMQILLPKQTHDLIEWGQNMHNCIGGYGSSIREGRTMCLAILKNDKMKYNLEISRNRLVQFRADRNSAPDPEDEKLIRKFLKERSIINESEREYAY